MVKPSSLQAFAHRPALVRSKCGFENRIKNTFFIRSVSAYRELLIAAVLVVTIVQHRTSVLDKTACVCSKTSRVEHTKSVHNRPKPAVFVRTALGLSSNQNEVAINSKSGLWRTALLFGTFLSMRYFTRPLHGFRNDDESSLPVIVVANRHRQVSYLVIKIWLMRSTTSTGSNTYMFTFS